MERVRCLNCGLINFAAARACRRCGATPDLLVGMNDYEAQRAKKRTNSNTLWRMFGRIAFVTLLLLFLWHVSITFTSESASFAQHQAIDRAAQIIDERGFGLNAFMLRYLVRYRATDSWWNDWTGHDTAYAATNFPFEVMTLYKDFYDVPVDDTERAVILLHESYHLLGYGEHGAFARVWRDKDQLGWTEEKYGHTKLWENVREYTERYAPEALGAETQSKNIK